MKKIRLNSKYPINKKHFRVAIFGSARIKRNDKNYKTIYKLAKLIGSLNIDIVTGGGPGIMEAANKGHEAGNKDHNSYSLGLLIKLPKEQRANKHLDIKKEFSNFTASLDQFMLLSNVVVVAPAGGIGTLLELIYTWQLAQVRYIDDMPIILMGDIWLELIVWVKKWLLENKFIDRKDLDFIFTAKNYEEAFEIIKKSHELYKKGKKLCVNLKKK